MAIAFSEYKALQETEITYDEYIQVLEAIEDGVLTEDIATGAYYMSSKLVSLYNTSKRDFKKIAKKSNMAVSAVVYAFMNPSVYNILRAFRFSFGAMFSAVSEAATLIKEGLFDVLEDLSSTDAVSGLERGLIKVDELLDRYPLLRKVTGPILAGVMVYMWLNMTFLGNFKYDMNLKNVALAMVGKYTITDFLSGNDGKSMLVLFGTGAVASFPWLGVTILNLGLALVYTGFIMLDETEKAKEIKRLIRSRR